MPLRDTAWLKIAAACGGFGAARGGPGLVCRVCRRGQPPDGAAPRCLIEPQGCKTRRSAPPGAPGGTAGLSHAAKRAPAVARKTGSSSGDQLTVPCPRASRPLRHLRLRLTASCAFRRLH